MSLDRCHSSLGTQIRLGLSSGLFPQGGVTWRATMQPQGRGLPGAPLPLLALYSSSTLPFLSSLAFYSFHHFFMRLLLSFIYRKKMNGVHYVPEGGLTEARKILAPSITLALRNPRNPEVQCHANKII